MLKNTTFLLESSYMIKIRYHFKDNNSTLLLFNLILKQRPNDVRYTRKRFPVCLVPAVSEYGPVVETLTTYPEKKK